MHAKYNNYFWMKSYFGKYIFYVLYDILSDYSFYKLKFSYNESVSQNDHIICQVW